MEKISVIVPAYNCQSTIERCIRSIQNQTYQYLEIVIVNDGSTDDTQAVLKDLQRQDGRIKVISIPNGGVSHARNIGIDNATGDYITFVDADDYIDRMMYETLLNLAKEYSVAIAHCSYQNVDNNRDVINKVGDTGRIVVQSHDEALKCLLSGRLFSGGNWNKLYDKLLFEKVRFDENIRINEDLLANYQLFDLAGKSVYIDRTFYCYVANDSSVTHSMRSNIGVEHSKLAAEKMAALSAGKSYQREADYRYAGCCLALYEAYLFSDNPGDLRKTEAAKKQVKTLSAMYEGKKKIRYFLLMYSPYAYKLIYKIYSKFRKKQLDPKQ